MLTKILRGFGLNRAISYGVFTRVWSLFAGPVTMLMIASRLSRDQQGYYYTIGSLLALQLFFELGLMTVISQFASHEFVNLSWGRRGVIEGDPVARERFCDLLCKAARWFAVAALLLIIVLIPAGLLFLGNRQDAAIDFSWRLPWILAVVGTAANLFTVPFFSVIMGSGDVVTVNHREMVGAVVSSILCWVVLGVDGGLFSVFAVTCGSVFISWSYLLRQKPALLAMTWKRMFHGGEERDRSATISWWGEVWPMQWKIALTWIAGYFVFQLFTPVLFRYHGPVVAGQMGMTLSAANALLGVSLSWINTRSPELGKCAATGNWVGLDGLFRRVLIQSTAVSLFGAIAGWAVIRFLQEYFLIGQRFIPASHAALLFAAISMNVVMAAFGAYLRAHKQEPFLPLSLTLGVVQGGATWFLGMKYSTLGVSAGFFVIHLFVALPVAYRIWRTCRKQWHAA
jgi:hypothetical protein